MTQSDRILRALRKGTVNCTDFAAPACDGLAPILRVAARVFDLQRQGHQITTRRRSNGTTNYTLVREAERSDGLTASEAAETADSAQGPPTVASLGAPAHPASELFDPAPYMERGGYRDAA